jgi:hypothetical protein
VSSPTGELLVYFILTPAGTTSAFFLRAFICCEIGLLMFLHAERAELVVFVEVAVPSSSTYYPAVCATALSVSFDDPLLCAALTNPFQSDVPYSDTSFHTHRCYATIYQEIIAYCKQNGQVCVEALGCYFSLSLMRVCCWPRFTPASSIASTRRLGKCAVCIIFLSTSYRA